MKTIHKRVLGLLTEYLETFPDRTLMEAYYLLNFSIWIEDFEDSKTITDEFVEKVIKKSQGYKDLLAARKKLRFEDES
jgi:hypothetical protein